MLKRILIEQGIPFENDKILIKNNFKRIKFDIGIAIEAIHTEDWLINNPDDLLVFGFEALPLCVEETKKYYSQPKSKWTNNTIDQKWLNNNFIIVPVALGQTTTDITQFYVTNTNVGCSSILKPNHILENLGVTINDRINVPICNLSDFFDLLPLDTIEYIEYIKVDVQGTDLDVIKSGGKYISEKVVFVTMESETDLYENSKNDINSMIEYMDSIGFNYIKHPNTFDPTFVNKKFLDIADSIYIHQWN